MSTLSYLNIIIMERVNRRGENLAKHTHTKKRKFFYYVPLFIRSLVLLLFSYGEVTWQSILYRIDVIHLFYHQLAAGAEMIDGEGFKGIFR